jgi:CBS-domain-containing membrane protein
MRRRIRDVMTREVVTVDEHTPFKEITQLLTDCRIGAVPVLDTEARVVGVVSEADLLLTEEYPQGPPTGWLLASHRRLGWW